MVCGLGPAVKAMALDFLELNWRSLHAAAKLLALPEHYIFKSEDT